MKRLFRELRNDENDDARDALRFAIRRNFASGALDLIAGHGALASSAQEIDLLRLALKLPRKATPYNYHFDYRQG